MARYPYFFFRRQDMRNRLLLLLLCFLPALGWADDHKQQDGLADTTVLIVRHAEKPDSGSGLSQQGEQRAVAYADYFDPLELSGQQLTPQVLIATEDSKHSDRPRLTLTPLSQRLQLPIQQNYSDDEADDLVQSLHQQSSAKVVLIAWHHGELGNMIDDFGGDSKKLLGHKQWPGSVYNWLIVLHFDHDGQLDQSQRVVEHLLPGDQ
ncbi:hypothetical protein [Paraburkholderia megapolitana]|nr:hypothetical protein [Paraburkholderia megapolitana]